MDFIKKNDFIVKNRKAEHFDRDLELFKKHCPESKLHNELKRVNSFNKHILVGLMLFELLDKVQPEDILKNRKKDEQVDPPAIVSTEPETETEPTVNPEDVSEIKEEIESLKDKVDMLESMVDSNESDIRNIEEDMNEKYALIQELETKLEESKANTPSKKKAK